jgi:hypothetical protein
MPGAPIERKPTSLFARYAGAHRVKLSVNNRIRIGGEDDSDLVRIATEASFNENGKNAGGNGVTLSESYREVERNYIVEGKVLGDTLTPAVKTHLSGGGKMRAVLALEASGNVSQNVLWAGAGRNLQPEAVLEKLPVGKKLVEFHKPVGIALGSVMLPAANKTVNPGDVWKTQRTLAAEVPGKDPRTVTVDLTCTYLGVRAGKGGATEAVVLFTGPVRDPLMNGKASGLMVVDVGAGVVRQVDLKADLDLPALGLDLDGKVVHLNVRSVLTIKLERN